MSWFRVYEIDILRVGQLYLQQGIDSLYPAAGTVLTSDGSGGTVWGPVAGSQAALTSTILGLGNLGYISTSQLQSTINGLGNIYLSTGGGGTGEVTSLQLQSTTRGLGTAGYISSLSSILAKTATISSLTTSNITASTGYISSLTVDSIQFGDGAGWIDLGVVRAQAVSTIQINSYIANLTQVNASSLRGDGSQIYNLNAISSSALQSTVVGLGNIYLSTGGGGTGEVTSAQLQSTTRGLGTAGYISTANLSSFSTAIGTSFFSRSTGVSSLNASYITALQGNVSSLQVNALTIGTGTGWVNMGPVQATAVSTIVFTTAQATVSSIQGDGSLLQNVAGLSTTALFTSNTSNYYKNLLQNWSTSISSVAQFTSNTSNYFQSVQQDWSTPLISTTRGLGTAGYVSSLISISSLNICTGQLKVGQGVFSTIYVNATPETLPNWQYANSEIIGLDPQPNPLAMDVYGSVRIIKNLYIGSTTALIGSGQINAPYMAVGNWVCTTSVLTSNVYMFSYNSATPDRSISYKDGNLIFGPYTGTNPPYGDLIMTSSVVNSTIISTVMGLGNVYVSTTGDAWSTSVSTVAQFTSNTSNYYSNLLQNWSTPLTSTTIGLGNIYLSTATTGVTSAQLLSTTAGLGTATYISSSQLTSSVNSILTYYKSLSVNISTLTTSNLTGITGYVSSLIVDSLQFGSGNGWVDIGPIRAVAVSTIQLNVDTIYANQVSSSTFFGDGSQLTNLPAISSLSLQSTLRGLGTAGYISTGQFLSSQIGMYSNVSSMIDPAELASTIIGLGSAGFVSSIGFTNIMNSTVTGLTSNISTMIDPIELASTVTGIAGQGLVSSIQLDKYLASTTNGLGTAGYVSTIALTQTSNYYKNLLQDWSTSLSTVALFTSNTSNYDRNYLQNWSTPLTSTTIGLGNIYLSTATGGVTSAQLLSTTAGLGNIYLSTSVGGVTTTQLFSTTAGLGTATYISSAQLTSSIQSLTTSFRSLSVNISTLTTSNLTGTIGFISSLQVNSLQFGDGNGWADFGAIRAVIISTIQLNTDTVFANQISSSTFLGDGSQLTNLPAISSLSLQSTVRGLGTAGYVSTIALTQTSNYFQNVLQNYSTMFSTAVSSVALFTSNTSNYFLNNAGGSGVSSLFGVVSSGLSTTALFTSNTSNWSRNLLQDWSTQQNTIYSFTSNTSNFYANVIQNYSTMFSTSVSSVALFTSNTSNYYSNVLQNYSTMFSTAVSSVALFTSNTSNYYFRTIQDWSTPVSTVALFTSNTSNFYRNVLQNYSTMFSTAVSSVALFTSNTSNYYSNVLQNYSTMFSTAVSSVALFTSNTSNYAKNILQDWSTPVTSTTLGLARIYLSSFSTFSLSTGTLTTSTLGFMDINTNQKQNLYVSSGVLVLNGQGIAGGSSSGGLTTSDYVVAGKLSADQSLTADADTTIQFVDDYDPQNWYNASTYFFTPTIAGYYLVSYQVWFNAGAVSNNQWNIQIQKNSADSYTITQTVQNTSSGQSLNATKIIYMNGSTDNLRFRAYVGNTSNTGAKALQGNSSGTGTFFTAALLTNGSSGDNLISTVNGLGTAGYVSTIALTQTSNYFQNTLQNWSSALSTVALFTSNTSNYDRNILQNYSTMFSTAVSSVALFTSNTSNYYSNVLQNWSTSVSSVALFTSNTSNYFLSNASGGQVLSSMLGIVSSGLSSVALFTSNTSNYYSNVLQNWSTAISTVALFTSNTSNYDRNILQNYSTMFSTAVSSVATFTSNTSNYYSNLLLFNASTGMSSFSTGIGTAFFSLSSGASSFNVLNLTGLTGTISSLQVNAITIGTGTGWVNMGPLQATAVSTIVFNGAQAVVSSIQGDGSQLQNVAGLSTVALFTSNTSNYYRNILQNYSTMFSTAVSSVALFTSNTSNYYGNVLQNYSTMFSTAVSSVALFTSNTSNYYSNVLQNYSTAVSSVALFTSNTSNYYANLLQNYSTMFSTAVSSVALFTSNTSNYYSNVIQNWSTPLSTTALFTSNTSNYYGNVIQNYSTMFSTAVSSVALFTSNTSNYYSNLQQNWSTSVSSVALFTSNTSNYYSNLQQNWSTPLISTTIGLGNIYLSTVTAGITTAQLTSTTAGLGTATYISSAQLVSSITSLTTSYRSLSVNISTLTTSNLTGTTGFISSLQVNSLQFGDGNGWADFGAVRAVIISTIQINTDTIFANQISSSTFLGDGSQLTNLPAISSLSLQSTVRGLGTAGYVSTIALTQTSNYFQNVLQNWSSPIYSSLIGLGTFGYISTGQFLSSQVGMFSNISSFVDPTELASTIIGIGSAGFVSSIGLTAILNSTVTGLTSNISTMIDPIELASTVTGIAGQGLVSSVQLDKYLASTTTGLGTAGYVSTIALTQTSNYFKNTLQNWSTSVSSVALFTSNTSNYYGNVLQNYSTMFSTAVSSVALFTSNTSNYYGNVLQNYSTMFSTAVSSVALFTSNTSNYYSNVLQNYSVAVSSVALFTSNTSNYFQNTLQNWSSPLTSTTIGLGNIYLSSGITTTQLFSTTAGLGTASYISSAQLTSSINSILTYYKSLSVNISTLTTSNLTGITGYVSSLIVDSLQFGSGNGWVDIGPIRAVAVSTIQINTDILYANQVSSSTFFGDGSQLTNLPAISSASLQSTVRGLGTAGYASTIALTQTSNYFQNTLQNWSSAVSSVALFTSNTSNYYSNTLQNWSSAVSTVALFTSNTSNFYKNSLQDFSTFISTAANTINSNITSTSIGLGTLGYISSLQLQSTTLGLQQYVSTFAAYPANTTGQVLYFNYSIPSDSPYKSLQTTPTTSGILQSTFQTIARTLSNQSVSQFKTDFTIPPFIPSGIWDINLYAKSVYTHSYLWASLHEINNGDDVKLIATSSNNPIQVTPANVITLYNLSLVVPYTNISTGNALSLRFYANNGENQDDQLTTYYEDSEYSHVHTTFGVIIPLELLTSTVTGLGTAGYISTAQYNTLSNYFQNTLQNWSTPLSTVAQFTSNTSNYFSALQGSTLSLSTGNVTTSTLYFKDPYANSIAMFQSSSLLFYGNVVLAGYGQLQPQVFTF